MTDLLHSAHDRPGFPLRESAREVVDGREAFMLLEERLIRSGMGKAIAPLRWNGGQDSKMPRLEAEQGGQGDGQGLGG
jgi:hypothetical protein